MFTDFFSGAGYLIRGARLTMHPQLRRYVLVPLGINVLVFSAAIWLGVNQFDAMLAWMLPDEGSWWIEYARTVLWIAFGLIIMLILFFTFNILANFIGAPFNGKLAEKVELFISGAAIESEGGFFSEIIPSVLNELKKLLYLLFLVVLLFLLLLIPGVNLLSTPVWIVFTSWMLASEYCAYPMENHRIYFSEIRKRLKNHKSVLLGFGCAIMLMSTLPVINFLVMPSAVSGATALWVERLRSDMNIDNGK